MAIAMGSTMPSALQWRPGPPVGSATSERFETRGGREMADRVVVLRSDDAMGFVGEACAEMVVAYSRLVGRGLADDPHGTARRNIIDHLVERLRQARAGEFTLPVLDIIDRLHGELTREPAAV